MSARYCILTAMRQCEALLPAYMRMVEAFDVAPTRIVIGVNDSTDRTLEILKGWNHPALDVFAFETGERYFERTQSAERVAHLAAVRNRIIERALGYDDWDFALMQDAAKMAGPEVPRLLMEDPADVVAPMSWHCRAPNSFWDTYCFRDAEGAPFTEAATFSSGNRAEVQSVGGVYSVRRRVLESGCRLGATDGRDCDSVPLCAQAREKGFSVAVRGDLNVTSYDFPNTVPQLPPINATLPAGDYVSPGMQQVRLDRLFPYLRVGDPRGSPWPYLRKDVPHNWYVDGRRPDVGFLNRDEAHILYNSALQFRGASGLEVGCWLGWSACHLAAAGLRLDVVDPLLGNPEIRDSVVQALSGLPPAADVNLVSGASPEAVGELAAAGRKWSLIFIDGNHDGAAPRVDAIECARHAAEDALVLFHDLLSPDVANGLAYFQDIGWDTMVYCTSQVMGVAWRGSARPVEHRPDPRVHWELPLHLRRFAVSGGHWGA